ncbi:unnamed protein product [Hermetia illucens]|uniref:acetate--CoA ligase n=1 Tax=Hermetia illucens TaxID=343691 RepID=A0A7R8UMA6_HERIL|nr:unnamed protein product [Hermetia illucens]
MPSEKSIYLPNATLSRNAYISSMEEYLKFYRESLDNPSEFWGRIAKQFHWETPADAKKFMQYNFDPTKGPVQIKWMEGASTNICYNLLDRNVKNGLADNIAFYWEGNHPEDYSKGLTYRKLLEEVCRFANVLKDHGVKKGDCVALYMPMILELPIAMLACARIGAIHSIVFAGFSSDSLAERMHDCKAKVLITADGAWRGEKLLYLKATCDEALHRCEELGHKVETCIVVSHLRRVTPCVEDTPEEDIPMTDDRDFWWHEEMEDKEAACYPEWMAAEDPLFMLYTSGSTGKPKGVLHTTAGYLLYASTTFKIVFDYKPANGATSVMFEGTPFYPDNSRFWQVIEKYKVSQFYTAPTAIRALMKFGEEPVKKCNLSTLKVLGSVGEPINPEAWLWYYRYIGQEKCSIVDTFWQTETGGHVITPLPGATPMKPGSASFPFFGVKPVLLDENGTEIKGEGEGYLAFSQPWPGMMRTLYNNHPRFENTYFSKFPGYYCTGDGARRDSDGYIWITGRVDDMLNVSGHLMSTAEVEAVLTEHDQVSEAAVVARPHPIKGQCLYCFITPNQNEVFNKKLIDELKHLVRERIGPFAQPDVIQNAPGLPKTRSGKIMRRVLRKVAVNDRDVGDISTLADEAVVEELFANRPKEAK